MTDRDRLIKLMMEAQKKNNETYMEYVKRGYTGDSGNALFVDIADHLLANGVIVPPCKVGDTIYCIDEHNIQVNECEVTRIELDFNSKLVIVYEQKSFRGRRYGCTVDYFGKTIFSNIEEAEKRLKRYGKFDR